MLSVSCLSLEADFISLRLFWAFGYITLKTDCYIILSFEAYRGAVLFLRSLLQSRSLRLFTYGHFLHQPSYVNPYSKRRKQALAAEIQLAKGSNS